MSANERQVGGNHYKTNGEEHWDRVHRLGLDYFQGQITKYVERWRKKNGVQDLEKARHFLDKYIELNQPKLTDAEVRASEVPMSLVRDFVPGSVPGYTYEGGYATHDMYRCTACKAHLKVELRTDPRSAGHVCETEGATPHYIDQDRR